MASIVTQFFQRPFGILTAVAAAIGGPYAAFETDLGTSIRRSLTSTDGTVAQAENNPASFHDSLARFDSNDPYSLRTDLAHSTFQQSANPSELGYRTSTKPLGQNVVPAPQGTYPMAPTSYPPAQPGYPSTVAVPPIPSPYPIAPNQVVATSYGPATIMPLGPTLGPSGIAQPFQSSQPIEMRSGPASAIPGSTDQLWDYTLGTPTLPQMQQQPNVSIGGGAVHDLREVLRFDITPGWLPQRFARVTTVTSNVKMDGLRVPLISGTQAKDIAGSLTYFFDANQVLKRIQLHGLTGDPGELANLMVQFYGLKPEASLGGKLFTVRWNNNVTSVLQIAPAPILYAGADHSKYTLFLELNQPSNQYGLSDEASEILRSSQATQRW
jgi:hypothetical protein